MSLRQRQEIQEVLRPHERLSHTVRRKCKAHSFTAASPKILRFGYIPRPIRIVSASDSEQTCVCFGFRYRIICEARRHLM
jgi:hypothetical protein